MENVKNSQLKEGMSYNEILVMTKKKKFRIFLTIEFMVEYK